MLLCEHIHVTVFLDICPACRPTWLILYMWGWSCTCDWWN